MPKPSFSSLVARWEYREIETQNFLDSKSCEWRQNPLRFWERVDPLSSSKSPRIAVPHLWNFIHYLEIERYGNNYTQRAWKYMQLRLSLSMLAQLQHDIEESLKCRKIAPESTTYRQISTDFVLSSLDSTQRRKYLNQLRGRKRCNSLSSGTLLLLGDTPQDAIENWTQRSIAQIQSHFQTHYPSYLPELDSLAIQLTGSLLHMDLDLTEVDATSFTKRNNTLNERKRKRKRKPVQSMISRNLQPAVTDMPARSEFIDVRVIQGATKTSAAPDITLCGGTFGETIVNNNYGFVSWEEGFDDISSYTGYDDSSGLPR